MQQIATSFDHLPLETDQYQTLRRYTRQFLAALRSEAAFRRRPDG